MRSNQKSPSPLELEILKVLWRAAEQDQVPMGVRDVRKALADSGRVLAHSSVITTLNIMVEKAFLKRTKCKNAYRFAPAIKQRKVSRQEVARLLDRVFDGSAERLMSALLETAEIDADQIAEIKRIIRDKEREGGQ